MFRVLSISVSIQLSIEKGFSHADNRNSVGDLRLRGGDKEDDCVLSIGRNFARVLWL